MDDIKEKLEKIINKFELSSDIIETFEKEYEYNDLITSLDKLSKLYEEKINNDISKGILDIRKKEIAIDAFEKHLNNIIKNN